MCAEVAKQRGRLTAELCAGERKTKEETQQNSTAVFPSALIIAASEIL